MTTSKIYIGIDPSINSTGVCVRYVTDGVEKYMHFYIIKSNIHELKKDGTEKDPLTKKEHEAEKKYDNFKYVLYDKVHSSKEKGTSSENEYLKTISLMNICEQIENIIWEELDGTAQICVCIEGISYGSSVRTTSVFDLAGLNYMIRTMLFNKFTNIELNVAPPSHVKKFATGNGGADKDLMMTVFDGCVPGFDIPKKDDIADAYFMSRMAQNDYNM